MSYPPDAASSTPPELDGRDTESEVALEDITALVLDIRREMLQRVRLYEWTLGLAVIPTLIAKGLFLLYRGVKRRSQGVR